MSSIIMHITAGQGPRECQWVVARLAAIFEKEAAADGLTCILLEPAEATASLLMLVEGDRAGAFIAARTGSIRWIGESPFRPNHKRKNWYVGVRPAPDADAVPDLHERDIDYQTMRASGPGGQHVNKTDSAVRATHRPTGLSCVSQDQRSQFANKKIARLKLAMLFEDQRERAVAQSKGDLWQQNRELERGNEVRCYEGPRFRLRV